MARNFRYLLNEPNLSELERKYVSEVMDKQWLSINGEHTVAFQKQFASYLGISHALAVQSGTSALHVSLKALGVGPGDRVITPNYSCSSSITVVAQLGAIPVIVDAEPESFSLNASLLADAIKQYKPKALQFVHVYGVPARDTYTIVEICRKNKVGIIEDAAESLGAVLDGKRVGAFGDIATFSIRSEKMIGVGEGGVVVTNDNDLFANVVRLASRSHRGSSHYWERYFCDGEGYNYRLPHLLGAVARGQMERFSELLKCKHAIGKRYRELTSGVTGWTLQKIQPNAVSACWLNGILFDELDREQVRQIGQSLENDGIEVRGGFWPLSAMEGFKSELFGPQDIGMRLYDKFLILPSSSLMTTKAVDEIIERVHHHYKYICSYR